MSRISGKIGLPPGTKEAGKRVDIKTTPAGTTAFDLLIETKGVRICWARSVRCSCVGYNDQTGQVDPKCAVCNGHGRRFFKPERYVADDATIGVLTGAQSALITKSEGVVIRGYLAGLGAQPDMFAVLGNFALGSATLTTRSGNDIGYYDRLIDLDGVRPHDEVVVSAPTVKLLYPALQVNFVANLTARFLLCDADNPDGDYTLVDGDIVWEVGKGPTAGTRVSVQYMHHPVWVCLEHMNLPRKSLSKAKKKRSDLTTPAGNTVELPGKVLVRLEHLPMDPG